MTSEAPPGVRVLHRGAVSEIVLSRPGRRNALDAAAGRELADAVGALGDRLATRAVIIRGEGDAFCAGGDVKTMAAGVRDGHAGELLREIAGAVHLAIAGIARMPKPVLAAVHGQAYGAGFSLALACDLVVAAEDAVFCQAFVKLGATPDSGSTYFLTRTVGRRKAAELILLGDPLPAPEALRLGLVNRVVPRELLDDHVRELAERLADGPGQAHARAKHLIADADASTLERQLDEERRRLGESAATDDFREGVQAFIERRPPRFGHHDPAVRADPTAP